MIFEVAPSRAVSPGTDSRLRQANACKYSVHSCDSLRTVDRSKKALLIGGRYALASEVVPTDTKIRRSFVDMASGPCVPVMVPSYRFSIRRLLPSTGSRRARFPRFSGATRRSDSLPSYPQAFVLLRLMGTVVHRGIRSAHDDDARRGGLEDVGQPLRFGCLNPRKRQGLPGS